MKALLTILTIALIALCIPTDALAQGCSMCTKTASQLGDKSARGLNSGILYLAALPLLTMATVGFAWWRRNGRHESF